MFKFPIVHLKRDDFDSDGNLVSNYFKNKITIAIVYSDTCPHCHTARKEYIRASEIGKEKFVFAAIHINGNIPGEKKCIEILEKILFEFRGVPDYAFFVNGRPTKIQTSARTFREILNVLNATRVKKPQTLHKW